MKRTVSAVEARQRLGELLEGVFYRGDEVIIERAGKRMGVVVPMDSYAIMAQNREELRGIVDQIRTSARDVPEEEVAREVAAAIREVRSARRRRPAASQ